jgi:glutathione peroxidase
VLGFQEPGTDEEILEFATSKYDVRFPMFSKIEVNGDGACDLYKLLKAAIPGDGESAEITWNFEKFLVDREGNVVERFAPPTTPEQVAEVIETYR